MFSLTIVQSLSVNRTVRKTTKYLVMLKANLLVTVISFVFILSFTVHPTCQSVQLFQDCLLIVNTYIYRWNKLIYSFHNRNLLNWQQDG